MRLSLRLLQELGLYPFHHICCKSHVKKMTILSVMMRKIQKTNHPHF